ncbi:MAG: hypothetical protein P8X57_14390, partial [Cyclobacteriaceae bacterium]
RIRVNTDLFALLDSRLRLDKVSVSGLNGNVHNTQDDESFNYQFIIDAFSSGSTDNKSDTTGSFTFEIGEVEITSSRGKYYDHFHGILADADIGELIAEAETFNLDSPYINVSYLALRNTRSRVEILQGNPYPEDTTSSGQPFNLGGEYAEILNTDFSLFVESAGLRMSTHVGQLMVEVDTLDINKQVYLGKNVVLTKSDVTMDFYDSDGGETSADTVLSREEDEPFLLIAGTERVEFGDNDFRLTDHTVQPSPGFDPARINLHDIQFSGKNLRMEDLFMEGTLSRLHAEPEDGPALVRGDVSFKYGPHEAFLKDLILETENSHFRLSAEASYPDTSALMSLSDDVSLSLSIDDGSLFLEDLFYFLPDLRQSMADLPGSSLSVSGVAAGTLAEINLNSFQAAIGGGMLRLSNARIRNVVNPREIGFLIPEIEIEAESSLISHYLGDSVMNSYNLPDRIQANSSLSGKIDNFNLESRVTSAMGNIEAWVDFQM